VTFSRRNFLKLTGLAGAGTLLGLKPAGDSLRILSADRSLSAATLSAFTDLTGASVAVAPPSFPGDAADCDLAIIPSHALTALIQRGEIRELSPISIPFPFEQRAYDPFNIFSLPAARGVVGINSRNAPPPVSWAEFFERARTEPAHLPPHQTFRAALKSLGHSINTRASVARAQARALVSELESVPLARARIALGESRPGWEFTLPAEGAELWEDCFCVPVSAPHPELARAFIQFALSAQPLAPLPPLPLEPLSPFAPRA